MSRVKPFISEAEESTMVAQRLIPYCWQNHRKNLICINDFSKQPSDGTKSKTFFMFAKSETENQKSDGNNDEQDTVGIADNEKLNKEEKVFETGQSGLHNVSTGTGDLTYNEEIKDDQNESGKYREDENEKNLDDNRIVFNHSNQSEDTNKISENEEKAEIDEQKYFAILTNDSKDEACQTVVLSKEELYKEEVEEGKEGIGKEDCMVWTVSVESASKSNVHKDIHSILRVESCDINEGGNAEVEEAQLYDENDGILPMQEDGDCDLNLEKTGEKLQVPVNPYDSDSDTVEYLDDGVRSVEDRESESETKLEKAKETSKLEMIDIPNEMAIKSEKVDDGSVTMKNKPNEMGIESDQVNVESESKKDIKLESASMKDIILESASKMDTTEKHEDVAYNRSRICRTDESEIVNIETNDVDIEQMVVVAVKISESPQKIHSMASENDWWSESVAKVPCFKPKVEQDEKPKADVMEDVIKAYSVNTKHYSNTEDCLNDDPHGLTLFRNLTTVDTETIGKEIDDSQTSEEGCESGIDDTIIYDLLAIQDKNSDKSGEENRNTQKGSLDAQVEIEDAEDDEVEVTRSRAQQKDKATVQIKEPPGTRRSCRYKANIRYAESDPESDTDKLFMIEDVDIMSRPRTKRRRMAYRQSLGSGTIVAEDRHTSTPDSTNNQNIPVLGNLNNQQLASVKEQTLQRQRIPFQKFQGMPNKSHHWNKNSANPRYQGDPYSANQYLPYTSNQQGTAQSTFHSNAIVSANSESLPVSNCTSIQEVTSASKDVQVLTTDVASNIQVTAATGICYNTVSSTPLIGHSIVPSKLLVQNPVKSLHNLDLQSIPSRSNMSTANLDLQPASSTAISDHHPAPVLGAANEQPTNQQSFPRCKTSSEDAGVGVILNDVNKDSNIEMCATNMIISMPQEHTSTATTGDLPSHIMLANKHGIASGFHPYSFGDKHLQWKTQWLLERCAFVKSEHLFMPDKRDYVDYCQGTMIAMFICNICGGIFESDKALSVHKRVTLQCLSHPQDLFHVIGKVNKQTGEQSNVISPLVKVALNRTDADNTTNTESCLFSCKVCPAHFTSIGDAIIHVGRAHLRCSYMYCHLCGSILCSKELFIKHLLKFHPQMVEQASQIIPCHCCHKNFNTEWDLRKHYSKVHKDPFWCKICYEQLLSVEQLLEHLLRHCDHSQPTLTQCPVCGNAYDFRFFGSHILAKHTNSEISSDPCLRKCQSIMVKCDFCGMIFTENEIIMHRLNGNCRNVVITMDVKSAVKQWVCKKCKVATNSFYEWRQHTSIAHADVCGSSSQMLEGVRRSVVLPVMNCKIAIQCLICCEKVYSNNDVFKRHLNLHNDIAQICNMTSVVASDTTAQASARQRAVKHNYAFIVQQDTSKTSNMTSVVAVDPTVEVVQASVNQRFVKHNQSLIVNQDGPETSSMTRVVAADPTAEVVQASVNQRPVKSNQTLKVQQDTPKTSSMTSVVVADPTFAVAHASVSKKSVKSNHRLKSQHDTTKTSAMTNVVTADPTIAVVHSSVNQRPVKSNQTLKVQQDTPKTSSMTSLMVADPTFAVAQASVSKKSVKSNHRLKVQHDTPKTSAMTNVVAADQTIAVAHSSVSQRPVKSNQTLIAHQDTPKTSSMTSLMVADPTFAVAQASVSKKSVKSNHRLKVQHDTPKTSAMTNAVAADQTIAVAHSSVNQRPVKSNHTLKVQQDTPKTSAMTNVVEADTTIAVAHSAVNQRPVKSKHTLIVQQTSGRRLVLPSYFNHPGATLTMEQTLTYMNVSNHYATRMLGSSFGEEYVNCAEIAHNKNLHVILDKRLFCEHFKVSDDYHTCSICGGIFYDKSLLEKHMEDVKTLVRHPQDTFHFIQQVDDDGLLTPVISKLVSVIAGTFDENSEQATTSEELFKYKCVTCENDFKSLAEAITHVGRSHFDCPYMFCDLCGTVLSDPHIFVNHATKFHVQKVNEYMKIIPCYVCPENFTDRKLCLEHIKEQHANDELTCSSCDFEATSVQQLAFHMLAHDASPFAVNVCPVCGDSMYYHLLGDHVLSNHSERWGSEQPLPNFPQMTISELRRDIQIKCGVCNGPYMSLKALKDHRMNNECPMVLTPGEAARSSFRHWICKKCEKSAGRTFHDWRIHVAVEHADLCYFASQCDSIEAQGSRSSGNRQHNEQLRSDPNNSGPDEVVTPVSAMGYLQGDVTCVPQNSPDEVRSLPKKDLECSEIRTGVEGTDKGECDSHPQNQNIDGSVLTTNSQKEADIVKLPLRSCDSSIGEVSSEVPKHIVFKLPANWPVLMHMETQHSCKGQCLHCGRIVPNDRRRRKHAKTHLRPAKLVKEMVICDICGKNVPEKSLKNHVRFHKEGTIPKRKIPCEICGKMVTEINTHMLKHQNSAHIDCICPHCNKHLPSAGSLTRHIRHSHTESKNKIKEFSCPMCPWKYVTAPLIYKLHVNTHTKEKVHKCEICSKEFCSSVILYTHRKVHEEGRHECPEEGCGLKFRQKCTLTRHLVTHSKEKPYKCKWCASGFAQSYPLSLHIKKKHKKHYEEFLAEDGKRRIRKDRFGPVEKDQD